MDEMDNSALAHPHDSLVRNILADADLAADLLRNYLDPGLVSALDLDSLRREAGGTVVPGLSKLEGDLRYSARFKGSDKELKVFVLLEHQSSQDRFMSFRMLGYIHAVYQEMLPKLKKGERFPYPLAVVLHHGKSPWKKIPPMRELIDCAPDVEGDILGLPIHMIDVAAMSTDALRGHPMVCALLESLQSASTGLLSDRLAEIVFRLQNIHNESRLKSWCIALARYYGAVEGYAQESVDALRHAFSALLGVREAEKMTVTIAQHWRNEGIAIGEARGEALGEARGEAKGQAKGKAESVLIILDSRFGEIPSGMQQKLRSMQDGSRVEELIKLAATCGSFVEFQKAL